jgi:hypothetical protein
MTFQKKRMVVAGLTALIVVALDQRQLKFFSILPQAKILLSKAGGSSN